MQLAAIHPDMAVVSDLNTFDGTFVHRRTDLTNIGGQSRPDLESRFAGHNHAANNCELRKGVVRQVELDGPGENSLEELVVSRI